MNGFTNNLEHERGVISMARSRLPNSAGSQFFIMVEKAPHLDGQYASFGSAIEGMEEVKPLEDQRMKVVTVETFGEEYGEVEKI